MIDMVYGIGLDICEISRMRRFVEKGNFVTRYFTEAEREYAKGTSGFRFQSLAGIFAAKEAFVKALGTGFFDIDLLAVEIQHTEYGQPVYRLSGWAARELNSRGVNNCHLSISHDGDTAMAFAILETQNAV